MNHDLIIDQARFLHHVIKRLQTRLMVKHGAHINEPDGEGADLTMPQLSALMVLRERDNRSLKEMAKAMRVSSPSASSMVDRLVELGMLDREQNKLDRREILVRLSARGKATVESLENQLLAALIELLERLGPDLSANWCAIYQQIARIIDSIESESPREIISEGVH